MTFGAYMMTMNAVATFDVTRQTKKENVVSRFFKRMMVARQEEANKVAAMELAKFRVHP